MFYVSDELRRPVLSGLCTSQDIEACKTTNVKATYTGNIPAFGGYTLQNASFQCKQMLTVNYYDNYDFFKLYNIQLSLYMISPKNCSIMIIIMEILVVSTLNKTIKAPIIHSNMIT